MKTVIEPKWVPGDGSAIRPRPNVFINIQTYLSTPLNDMKNSQVNIQKGKLTDYGSFVLHWRHNTQLRVRVIAFCKQSRYFDFLKGAWMPENCHNEISTVRCYTAQSNNDS